MKRKLSFKEAFYSFMGGTVASLACTILYEAINQIGNVESSVVAYVLEWIAGVMMCISCTCLLWLASNLGEIENKLNIMIDTKKDANELWFRAIRALAEKKIQTNDINRETADLDALVKKEANKIYYKLIVLLVIGCFSFVLGMVFLVISKVV